MKTLKYGCHAADYIVQHVLANSHVAKDITPENEDRVEDRNGSAVQVQLPVQNII